MENRMSMGTLGDKYQFAMTIESYEFLKDLDLSQMKVWLEDSASFVTSMSDRVCSPYRQHKKVAERIHKKFNEDRGTQYYADKFKDMIEFLMDVEEETIFHDLQFRGLEIALQMLSKDIANLL